MFVSLANALSVWNAGQVSHLLLWRRCRFFHTWMEKYFCVCTSKDTQGLIHMLLWLLWQQGAKPCWKAQGHAGVYMLTHRHTLTHTHTHTHTKAHTTRLLFPPKFSHYHKTDAITRIFLHLASHKHMHKQSASLSHTQHTHKHMNTGWIAGAIKREQCLTCPWNCADSQRCTQTHTHCHSFVPPCSLYYILQCLCLEMTALSGCAPFACGGDVKCQRVY